MTQTIILYYEKSAGYKTPRIPCNSEFVKKIVFLKSTSIMHDGDNVQTERFWKEQDAMHVDGSQLMALFLPTYLLIHHVITYFFF